LKTTETLSDLIDKVTNVILEKLKTDDQLVPIILKSPNDEENLKIAITIAKTTIKKIINQDNDKPTINWIILVDSELKIQKTENLLKEHFPLMKNYVSVINWKTEIAEKKSNNRNQITIFVIEESHKDLSEEKFFQLFIKTKPEIILKISTTPFKTKEDELIFKQKILQGTTEYYFSQD